MAGKGWAAQSHAGLRYLFRQRVPCFRPCVQLHQLWLIYMGYGVLGGIGLGLGYISPVSTLIKWFPDRPGMATGMAIMGFGGGAFIGAPLATNLMAALRTDHDLGVAQTFLIMGAIYFAGM